MHAVRIDEILIRRGGAIIERVLNPTLPAHQEAAVGRPFGFICVNMPRTPQLEALVLEVETVIEHAYTHGSLRPGQTAEQFFEQTVAGVRKAIADALVRERIKVDPSLLTIVLAVVVGTDIYLTRHGKAEAYLLRREANRPTKIVDVFRGFDDGTDERLLNDLVIGNVAENDILLIATGSLFNICPIADIVEATDRSEAPAVAARIRSIILSSPEGGSVVGALMRLSPIRTMFRAKENTSVTNLRSREEEVARTLSPSGLPAMGVWIDRLKTKNKPVPKKNIVKPKNTKPAAESVPKKPLLERFNNLPIAAKRAAIVLLALLAIFFVSLKIISANNARRAAEDRFNTAVSDIKRQIDLAESASIYDESRGRLILAGAQSMEKALSASDQSQAATLANLVTQLTTTDRKLQHLYETSPKTLETLKAPANFTLKTASGWLMNAGPDLILLNNNGSPTTIATLPDVPVWATVASDTDNAIYLWLKNDTLVVIGAAGESLPRVLDYSGPSNPRDGAMWNGHLYVLTSDGTQIWKLPPTLTGFGRGVEWLEAPLNVGATSLVIDGSVYGSIPRDAVRQFSGGKMSPFAASGATANADPIALVLGANDIYLLGADNSIAVWDKTGKLLAQYSTPGNEGKIAAFAVDETTGTIVFATNQGVVSEFTMVK
jgi:hypothetical protein